MELTTLTALSPLDGRYFDKVSELSPIFSEFGLIKFRLFVEIKWLEALANEPAIKEIKKLSKKAQKFLDDLWQNFDEKDALEIKAIEKEIKHDVKAVEYFLKKKFKAEPELKNIQEFIHFALTSDDTNNIAYALMLKKFCVEELLPEMDKVINKLQQMAHEYSGEPMLARTHGQPASPTTVGKELANFVARLIKFRQKLSEIKIEAKCNGAVGNFNAHLVAYPNVDWQKLANKFIAQFGLIYNEYTTQIEPHDSLAEFCDTVVRFNLVLLNLTRDIWGYISLGYFKQKITKEEVGSSTMPHKVNPIDFENAEGNLGMANAFLRHLSDKLVISRWQRDLSDSTCLRNLGPAFGYVILAYKNLETGLTKLTTDQTRLNTDLNEHWEILAEAVQTVMRKFQIAEPYEKLKALTRGQPITKEILHNFIQSTKLPEAVKKELLELTPLSYLGIATELAEQI
jgi:adenylosuccinate lyase